MPIQAALSAAPPHPYAALTPDTVLDALASVGALGDGRLQALSSYENRVYLVHLEQPCAGQDAVVAKFYRPGRWSEAQILEEHAFAFELVEEEIPLVAPLRLEGRSLHHHGGFAFSLSPRRGGRAPELDDPDVLEWIGRFLARIHQVGAGAPFASRGALDIESFGGEPRDWLLEHDVVPLDLRSTWAALCQTALQRVGKAFAEAGSVERPIRQIRVHGDCHPGNILWTPSAMPSAQQAAGPHFVDLDDTRSAPAVQDLWMLLSGDRRQRGRALSALLEGYEQMRPFDRRELVLIEPLRTLRMIHYSAWLARRWQDPIFPINFPWFGSSDYWQGQAQALEEQLEAMDEAPLGV
jgi:Ser/Thr protein kinase RdoA (MazF antagonist)